MTTQQPGVELARRPFTGQEPPGSLSRHELQMLAAVQRGEDSGRAVYADWLETQGRHFEADYVRAELKLQRAPKVKPESLRAAFDELRAASMRVSPGFRAWVSRPSVENCKLRFELKCPLEWASLSPTADAKVRDCSVCHQQVRFCGTVEEAAAVASGGGCVAVDLAQPRRPGDLRPPQRMMGRVARR